MKILVACEYSGRVRNAFRAKGHEVWSCDLEKSDDDSKYHIVGDVVPLLASDWDMIIAHPPCTYLANSGSRWLYEKPGRWELMKEGAEFFKLFLDHPCSKVAVENPVMHKHALEIVGRKHDFSVQPWQHGEPYKKGTCFWVKGLPEITPTNLLDKKEAKPEVWKMGPSADRGKKRSLTYQGIANAMAHFWG